MIDLVHLNARTDSTRRGTKTFMLGRNLAQFNDCLEGICKIDDRDQPTSTTHLSKEGRRIASKYTIFQKGMYDSHTFLVM